MKDYFPKKPLDYPKFIEELAELQRCSLSDESLQWSPDAIGFRKWKASLLDLLARIKKAGYNDIRCEVEDRRYQYYGPGEEKHGRKFFNKAVDDTNIEMQLIIDNFKKHGDPHANPTKADPTAPKPFDYPAFVSEIAALVARAEKLTERDSEATVFREWRHETQDAINRIRRLRYPVACGIAQRTFTSRRIDGSVEAFNRDMEDTLIELRLIVSNFKKYGSPDVELPLTFGKAPKVRDDEKDEPAPAAVPLAAPEKVTWTWVKEHVSLPWMLSILGGSAVALFTAFSLGLTAGGTKAGQTIVGWFAPGSAPASSAATATKAVAAPAPSAAMQAVHPQP